MALGLALPVMHLQAQDESKPQRPNRQERGARGDRPGGPGFLAALDANKDGKLDKSEIAASTEALKKLDKDSDGKLTMAELRGGRGPRGDANRPQGERPDRQQSEARAGQRPALPPLLASLDANKDGVIETDELSGAPAALAKLDKNNDGELTGDEMRMRRGQRGAERPANGERPRRNRSGSADSQNKQ